MSSDVDSQVVLLEVFGVKFGVNDWSRLFWGETFGGVYVI